MSEWDLACTRGHPDAYGVVNLYTARKSFAFDLAYLHAKRHKKANLALGLLLYAFKPFALFCFHKISAHFFRTSSSFGLCPHSTQNPPLEFSSRPVLSLALLRLCSLRTSLTGLCPSENPQKKSSNFH